MRNIIAGQVQKLAYVYKWIQPNTEATNTFPHVLMQLTYLFMETLRKVMKYAQS